MLVKGSGSYLASLHDVTLPMLSDWSAASNGLHICIGTTSYVPLAMGVTAVPRPKQNINETCSIHVSDVMFSDLMNWYI